MAGENFYTNIHGFVGTDFVINAAAPTAQAKTFGDDEGTAIELVSGAFTVLRAEEPRFTNGADADLVTKSAAPGAALLGDYGYLSAPFAAPSVVTAPCDGILAGCVPGLEVGAGVPVFAAADMMDAVNGPFTRLSCSAAAGNWFGLRDTFGLPNNYVRGIAPRQALMNMRLAVPDYSSLSFFVGGLEGASAILASGADPTAAGLTGAAAFVKLDTDANWHAFVRLPGSAVPTKIDLGVVAGAGTVYIFLLECLLATGGVGSSGDVRFSIYNSSGFTLLGQTTISGFPAFSISGYLFDAGAFTATAASRSMDVYNAMVVQQNSFDA